MVIKSGSDSSQTDHLVIPIQSGSAPEQTSDFLSSRVANGDTAHSPELEDVRFSDSEDQRSQGSASIGSSKSGALPQTETKAENFNSAHWRHSLHPVRSEGSAVYARDSRSTSSAERVLAKPLPPPKPMKSMKRRPGSSSQSPAKPPTAKPLSGDPPREILSKPPSGDPLQETSSKPPSGDPLPMTSSKLPSGEETSRPKPPPKPARNKHRSMKIEERVSSRTESAQSYRKSYSMKERSPSVGDADGFRSSPAPLEKSSSEHSLRTARLGSNTSIDSNASDGARKPKPLPKPRALSKPAPPPKAAKVIESRVLEKLAEEGIDLTQVPYSTVVSCP